MTHKTRKTDYQETGCRETGTRERTITEMDLQTTGVALSSETWTFSVNTVTDFGETESRVKNFTKERKSIKIKPNRNSTT